MLCVLVGRQLLGCWKVQLAKYNGKLDALKCLVQLLCTVWFDDQWHSSTTCHATENGAHSLLRPNHQNTLPPCKQLRECQRCRENEVEDPGQHTLTFTTMAANVDDRAHCDMSQGTNAEHSIKQQPVSQSQLLTKSSSGKSRHSYFRARKLQRVCAPI